MKAGSLALVVTGIVMLAAILAGSAPAGAQGLARASVAGRVVSTSNERIAEPHVRLEPPAGEVRIEDDGSYRIDGLAAGAYVLVASAEGYTELREVLTLAEGAVVQKDLVLTPAGRALGEITVSSSFSLNRSDPVPGVALDRQQLLDLPHVGDDVIRALPLLPGVAAGDTSGRFSVRGGLFREVLFRLDGLEIYEPYHLKDYDGVFSIIDPRLLDDVELLPGGFTAEHGDRSTAVLDLRTVEPSGPATGELGISFMTLWANGQGGLADDRGTWFASVRRGFLDLVMDLVGPEDSETERSEGDGPVYWDVNAKLGWDLRPGHALTGRLLWSDDGVDEEEWEIEDGYPEYEHWDTGYGSAALWLHDARVVGGRSHVTTVVSSNRLDRDRRVAGEDYVGTTTIRDERELTVLGLRQGWGVQLTPSHYLKAGLELRHSSTELDYFNRFRNLDEPTVSRAFEADLESTDLALWLADRLRLGPGLTAELGLRWDRYDHVDDDHIDEDLVVEDHVAPRVNLVWSITPATSVRAAWGHVFQSQRPHELQVEDGETRLAGAERAEHRILGLEHWWQTTGAHWSLRAEAYQRLMTDVRPRYENLFDIFQLFPETSYDRYRIAPESAEATGAELFLARRSADRLDWWLSYAWSEVTDRVDGRDVPRQHDQTHAVTASLTWRPSPRWTLTGAWTYHTGWPTTAVHGELVTAPDGTLDIVPVLGPVNAERLPDYHRLDLRLARRLQLKRHGTLELFLDVQNAYDRRNISGYAVDDRAFSITGTDTVVYSPRPERWLGILPSFGVSWSF